MKKSDKTIAQSDIEQQYEQQIETTTRHFIWRRSHNQTLKTNNS